MAKTTDTCYQEQEIQWFQAYLDSTNHHQLITEYMDNIVSAEFKRIGEGKNSMDVLGVGSGGGQKDVHLLTLLQSTLPGVPVSAEIIEGSVKLSNNFKAFLAKTPNLSTVPFSWHMMRSEDYMKQAEGELKKFDFIHMIQMIYFVEDMEETFKFYHGLLKRNGRLMIIVEAANCGWEILWTSFEKELCTSSHYSYSGYNSAEKVKKHLEKMGLKYEEHLIPAEFDISEVFNPESRVGRNLLNFITLRDFYASFTPETRAAMLDVVKNECSNKKDGKIIFKYTLSCILVHA